MNNPPGDVERRTRRQSRLPRPTARAFAHAPAQPDVRSRARAFQLKPSIPARLSPSARPRTHRLSLPAQHNLRSCPFSGSPPNLREGCVSICTPPSSSGQGRRLLRSETEIRILQGTPQNTKRPLPSAIQSLGRGLLMRQDLRWRTLTPSSAHVKGLRAPREQPR